MRALNFSTDISAGSLKVKAAEIALARGLVELTVGTGVTVNSVLPGPTASSGSGEFLDDYALQQNLPRDNADADLIPSIWPNSLLGI